MKRFIITLLFLAGFTLTYAQTQWYKTSYVALRYKTNNQWTNWSDWEKCVCSVKFDLDNDMIVIYSNKTQVYKILYQDTAPYDNKGKQISFKVIDQDFDYGHIRLRITNDGDSQLYVDFADISWVYSVRRTQ